MSQIQAKGRDLAKKSGSRSQATTTALVDATLRIVKESGVKSVTHRRVCDYAGVALGSSTYHYETLDNLILDAFGQYVETVAASYENRLAEAQSDTDLIDSLMQLISVMTDEIGNATLQWELLAESGRDDAYAELIRQWSTRARSAVETYVSSETAHMLEVIWDGAIVQRAINAKRLSDGRLRDLIMSALSSDPIRGYPRQATQSRSSSRRGSRS